MSNDRPKTINDLATQSGLAPDVLLSMLQGMGIAVSSPEDPLSHEIISLITGEDDAKSTDESSEKKTLTLGTKKNAPKEPAKPASPLAIDMSKTHKKTKANQIGKATPSVAPAERKAPPKKKKDGAIKIEKVEETKEETLIPSEAEEAKPKEPAKPAVTPKQFADLEGQTIIIKRGATLGDLVDATGLPLKDLISTTMQLGLMVSRANQRLSDDIITQIATALKATVSFEAAEEPEPPKPKPTKKRKKEEKVAHKKKPRPPVVTIMGHVDHGKTTLLDTIRNLKEKVADKEAGKITQHIGAYHVKHKKGAITFIDTPGHEAFSAMRHRGAQVTDVVILVVAADDAVMPQTVEAIEHAHQAGVPIVVAINKIDKENTDINRVTSELAQHDVSLESWGGSILSQPISAKTGEGIDALLDAVLLQSEMLECSAYDEGLAEGVVLESKLDRGRGPVATILIQNGRLKSGQNIFIAQQSGKIRAMLDSQGNKLKEAGPSMPVEILGLSGVPAAGDPFKVFDSEKAIKEAIKKQTLAQQEKQTMDADTLQSMMLQQSSEADGKVKILNVIIKADSHGSVEAIRDTLNKRSSEETRVKIISAKVGGINDSDVRLSMTAHAMLVGFHVRTTPEAQALARQFSVKINHYSIIYDLIEDIEALLLGLTAPKYEEIVLGSALIKQVFRSSKYQSVAGCLVQEASIKKQARARIRRKNDIVFESNIESIRHLQNTIDEAKKGTECGIAVKKFHEYEVGDIIETFEKKLIKPTKAKE